MAFSNTGLGVKKLLREMRRSFSMSVFVNQRVTKNRRR
jgi:hypothetical protein